MKISIAILVAALAAFATPAIAQERPTLTPQQKLVAAQAVTALVLGPVILPVAVITGNREALCHAMEGPVLSRRSSFNNNSDGLDQCPRGNWLRLIPIIKSAINDQE